MRKILYRIFPVILVIGSCCIAVSSAAAADRNIPLFVGLHSEIFVDTTNTFTLDDIRSASFDHHFIANRKVHFNFGMSTNTNWLRFRMADVAGNNFQYLQNPQLYFNWAAFYDLTIYLPTPGKGEGAYTVLKSGMRHGGERNDRGFVFPVFDLPKEMETEAYTYVRIQGPFTSNFQLVLTEAEQMGVTKFHIISFLSFVFGIMVAMLLYNLLLYLLLRDRNYLWYAQFLFFVIIYQAPISGITRIFSTPVSDFLMMYAAMLGLLAIAAHLAFTWCFLDVPRTASALKNFYRFFWVLCAIGVGFGMLGQVYQANIVAYFVAGTGPFLVMLTAVISYRNGHWISKYYLLAVGMLMISVVTFALRGLGVVEHSLYTSYSILSSSAIESLLFSFALADRFRRLQKKHTHLQKVEKELSKISITDDLTGLYNRRHFDAMLGHAIDVSQKNRHDLSLIFLDIDNFKNTNDIHGHLKGDEVLRDIAGVIQRFVRTADYPCRIGGDEFAVIMPHTDLEGAERVAERIRRRLGEIPFDAGGGKLFFVSLSIGVARYIEGEPGESLLTRADKALYLAKAQGRNKTVKAPTDFKSM